MVYFTRRFVLRLSLFVTLFLYFFSPFSIAITWLGEERELILVLFACLFDLLLFDFCTIVQIIFHFLWDHWAHCGIFENGDLLMYTLEGVSSVAGKLAPFDMTLLGLFGRKITTQANKSNSPEQYTPESLPLCGFVTGVILW